MQLTNQISKMSTEIRNKPKLCSQFMPKVINEKLINHVTSTGFVLAWKSTDAFTKMGPHENEKYDVILILLFFLFFSFQMHLHDSGEPMKRISAKDPKGPDLNQVIIMILGLKMPC